MKKRPTSITVIAWILIVTAGISVVTNLAMIGNTTVKALMAKSPLPMAVQYSMIFVGLLVMLASGLFMLRGKAWARALYVAWSILGFIVSLATSPMKMAVVPGILFFAVVVFFLFRPAANEFFSRPRDGSPSV